MKQNISDNDILKALSASPEQGFRMLMEKYSEPIYWHIRRLVVAHADAQDAAQETFIRVFRSLHTRDSKASLAAWIYRIATNEALRLIGRRKHSSRETDIDASASVLPYADEYVDYSNLESVRLQKAILSLPQKQQIVFSLRYYDELSYADIADATNSSAAAVKVNYHIAKIKIQTYMNSND